MPKLLSYVYIPEQTLISSSFRLLADADESIGVVEMAGYGQSAHATYGRTVLVPSSDSIRRWVDRVMQSERSPFDGAELMVDVLDVGVVRRKVTVRIVGRRPLAPAAGLSDDEWRAIAHEFGDELV